MPTIAVVVEDLPTCTGCGKAMITQGTPRALMNALYEQMPDGVAYARTAYLCTHCFTPPGWTRARGPNGEPDIALLPPPNEVVQVEDILGGHRLGIRLGDTLYAVDEADGGRPTAETHITHWCFLDLKEFQRDASR